MPNDDDSRIIELFEAALDLSTGSERTRFLDESCARDAALRTEIEALLRLHAETNDFLEPARISRFAPGDVIAERYEVAALVGRGGMGEVYRAVDSRLDREVALKVLPERRSLDPGAVQRFEREVQLTASLSHPNVMALFDVVSFEGQSIAVLELLSGRTLDAIVNETPASTDFLRDLAAGVGGALATAHARGVVHRDIKPQNIMVCDDGGVKVLDFGIARRDALHGDAGGPVSPKVTADGAMVGTVPYMSPEQAEGEPVGPKSDVFSFGTVLYEIATGRHPFRASTVLETLRLISAAAPIAPSRWRPDLPPAFDGLLSAMLAREPDGRPDASEIERWARSPGAFAASSESSAGASNGPSGEVAGLPTVSRSREIDELRDQLRGVQEGRGRVLFVTGEPGIGKTTLIDEFLREASASTAPCVVARGACSERLAGSDGYLPLLEALEEMLRGESRADARRLLARLAPAWSVLTRTGSIDGLLTESQIADARTAWQERMKRELVLFLDELSRTCPVILFLDDLQWVDVSTSDLLAHVGLRVSGMRLLVIASYRPSELSVQSHPFLKSKLELQSRRLSTELALKGLTEDELDEYLQLRFPGHRFPASLFELLYSRTEGQPLFLVDLLHFLEDAGILAEAHGHWSVVQEIPDLENELPESTRSMIQKKIDQTSEDDRRLLVTASVQGQEFHAAVVAQALGLDDADIEERLEALERLHGFVTKLGENELPDSTLTVRYRFAHALYQNALYAKLTPARRARQSAAVADSLVDLHSDRDDGIALEVALLYEVARRFRDASDRFLQAARNAGARFANHEAVSLAQRSIDNANRLDGEDRHSRVLRAARFATQLHERVSRYDLALEAFTLAENAAIAVGDAVARVESVCGKATCLFFLKKIDRSREEAGRALELARAEGSSLAVAQAESVRALAPFCEGDLNTAVECFDRAIPVIRSGGRPGYAMNAVAFRTLVHAWRLEYADADRGARWWFARSKKLGVHSVPMNFFHGMSLGNEGRISEALTLVREGRRQAELNEDGYHASRLPNVEAWLLRELGDDSAALRLDEESVDLGRSLGFQEAEANARVNLAAAFIELGEHERAREHLDAASRLFENDNWFRWRYYIRLQAVFGSYWLARGDLLGARRYVERSLELARASQARKHIATAHKLLGDLSGLEDRVDDATQHYSRALRTLAEYSCPTIEWKVLDAAARLARARRDSGAETELRGRALKVIGDLARGISEEPLRRAFLASERVRSVETP